MKCERCGEREATIHATERSEGLEITQWLCAVCAGLDLAMEPRSDHGVEPEESDDPQEGDWEGGEQDAALDRFIGQMFVGASSSDDDVPDCPACSTSYASFRGSGRLGCPRCYVAFRRLLLPFLGRFHRQVTHLGKFPVQAAGSASRLGEITRTRIALEKAVAAEDFEEAARLRERIRDLETPFGDDPAEPAGGVS